VYAIIRLHEYHYRYLGSNLECIPLRGGDIAAAGERHEVG